MKIEHPVEDAFDLPEDAYELPEEFFEYLEEEGEFDMDIDAMLAHQYELEAAFMTLQTVSSECLTEFFNVMKPSKRLEMWAKLIDEEFLEVCDAGGKHQEDPSIEHAAALLKELADLNYVMVGFFEAVARSNSNLTLSPNTVENVGHALEAGMGQLGALMGIKAGPELLTEATRRIHASNMSKLGDNGKPVKRADGKILKGPNYQPPVLTDLVTPAA